MASSRKKKENQMKQDQDEYITEEINRPLIPIPGYEIVEETETYQIVINSENLRKVHRPKFPIFRKKLKKIEEGYTSNLIKDVKEQKVVQTVYFITVHFALYIVFF